MFLQKPMLGAQLDHSDSLNNPVLDLLFNEGYGDRVNDLSGYGNHGTLHGFDFPPTRTSGWNPGMDGVALTFDGSGDYIDCGNNSSLNLITGYQTNEIRLKTSSGGHFFSKFACGHVGGWTNEIAEGKIRAGMRDSGGNFAADRRSLTNVDDDEFHDIVTIYNYDLLDVAIYIDGILNQGALSNSGAVAATSTANVFIGARCTTATDFFKGAIARARILPRAMSAFEVMQTQINPYAGYLQ